MTMILAPDDTTIRVYFDQEMKHENPAEADDVLNPANYTFTTIGVGVSLSAVSITIHQEAPTVVNITLNREMTKGCLYRLTVENAKGIFGMQVIDPEYKSMTFDGFGYSPRVQSAEAIDGVVVRVIFDEAMLINSEFTNPANYTFLGEVGANPVAAESIQIKGVDRVEVWLSAALSVGMEYTVSVWNVKDLAGNEIDDPPYNSAVFDGVAQQTKLDHVDTVNNKKLRLWFNKPMLKNADLVNPASYSFTPSPGAAPLYFAQIRTPNELFPYYVDIETSEMTNMAEYTAEVSTSLQDRWGNHISSEFNHVTFDGLGISPIVSSVKAVSATMMDVFFDENMRDNADLRNKDKYVFDNGLSVLAVVEVDGARVRLQTSEQVSGLLYTLAVSA